MEEKDPKEFVTIDKEEPCKASPEPEKEEAPKTTIPNFVLQNMDEQDTAHSENLTSQAVETTAPDHEQNSAAMNTMEKETGNSESSTLEAINTFTSANTLEDTKQMENTKMAEHTTEPITSLKDQSTSAASNSARTEDIPPHATACTSTQTGTTQEQMNNTPHDSASPKQHKKKQRSYRTPLYVASCLLIGGIGGFAGTYLATSLQGSGNKTVLYQSVEKTDKDGNNITNMSVKDVVANTSNSVVEITTESAATDSFMQQMVTTGAGSGVIISTDGYIVTNNHVVEGATKVTVRTKDGTEYTAKLIGTDSKTDLAVIKIEATGLSAAIMGSSSDLSVGDEAIAIGNPLGELGGTVTQGIISALDREISIDGQTMTLLQTDTAINKGNSGGGLFNNNGELIGIVNAKSSGSSVEGLGFAIPIDTAKPVISSLIENGYVTGRPQLGVSMVNITDETSAFQAGVNELGVYIAKVNDGSAAAEAGLKVRDRVLSVDGEEVTSSAQISKVVSGKKVGDTLTLVVERDGKEETIKATLKEEVKDLTNAQSSNNESNAQNNNPYSKFFQ